MYGELIPVGGGDPIPLLKKKVRVGRRDGCDIVLNYANISGHHCFVDLQQTMVAGNICDIVLNYANISGHHCLLEIHEGYWFIKDLRSRNGVKVDSKKIMQGLRKRVDPGIRISIAKHEYELEYEPMELGAYGTPPQDEQLDNFFAQSLLDRAGLKRREVEGNRETIDDD